MKTNNRFKQSDYDLIAKKSNYKCGICNSWQIEPTPHHIIKRSSGGSGHYSNGVFLCSKCHYQIHHGLKSKEYEERTYKYITDLSKCWVGLYEPKIVKILKERIKKC